MNLVTGVSRPTQGKILFKDRDLQGLPTHKTIILGIARTFQNIRLFKELTVLDKVRIAHSTGIEYSPWEALLRLPRLVEEEKRIHKQALELLDIFGLADLAQAASKNLPYGQQRRLKLTRSGDASIAAAPR